MRRFFIMKRSPAFKGFEDHRVIVAFESDGGWDDDQEDDWNGCCEDPYDDEAEEEEIEREWCD